MRINKFVALATGMSRRAADTVVAAGDITVDGKRAEAGTQVSETAAVRYNSALLSLPVTMTTILLNKPIGYVCSRNGQGSRTIYELLPETLHDLKPIGRLDKDSSGILLLTNDGQLAQELTHPRYQKVKIYEIELNKPLAPLHQQMITDIGVQLDDGRSKLGLARLDDHDARSWRVTMQEGRNRQIRRTFEALGYTVTKLQRTQFGAYSLHDLHGSVFINV